MTSDELKIDKRIVERNLKHGRLDAAEYQRMLGALPDLSDKVWRKPHAEAAPAAPALAVAPAPSAPVESEPPSADADAADVEDELEPAAPANYFTQG
jgi:hypothetical protein